MNDFNGRVAVITGAASGIGMGLAEKAAGEGMKVVLADIEEQALAEVERHLKSNGATTLALRTDVSKIGDVEALARKALDAFGSVDLLCNNAGVTMRPRTRRIWECTVGDWQWILGVNLFGVVHGVRTFTPIMLDQGSVGHIVNTASVAGLVSAPLLGVYKASKHAVVSISETLFHELREANAKVGVSVLCPGYVATQIGGAARNRPAELTTGPDTSTPAERAFESAVDKAQQDTTRDSLPPIAVAEEVFDAVRQGRFYIVTGATNFLPGIHARADDVRALRNPSPPQPRV